MHERHLQYINELQITDIRSLMETYGDEIWRYAYFLTGDAHLADDIAQETFIKAYHRFHTFRKDSSIKTWLLKIARNTAYTYKSRAFLRKVILMDSRSASFSAQTVPSAESAVIDGEIEDEIWQAVMKLPGKFRDPLLLRYHHQLSMEEIAEILSLSIGTVKSQIHRARQKAASLLKGGNRHD